MRKIFTRVDTNDADYVSSLVKVEDDVFEKFLPIINAINNFQPFISKGRVCDYNFGLGEWRDLYGDKTLYDVYSQFSPEYIEEFIDTFEIYGSEYGFHSIEHMEDVMTDEILIDGSWETIQAKIEANPKIQGWHREKSELAGMKSSMGINILSTPYNKMNDADREIINKYENCWKKYV